QCPCGTSRGDLTFDGTPEVRGSPAIVYSGRTFPRRNMPMTAVELVHLELKRLHKMIDATLDGLTPEQLHAVPGGNPKANTIAWGLWHYVRTEDNVVRFVLQNRRSPAWTEGG